MYVHTLTLHDAASITQHPQGAATLALHSFRPTQQQCYNQPPPPKPRKPKYPILFADIPHGMLRLFPPPFPLPFFSKISKGPRVSSLIVGRQDQPSPPSRGIRAID
ncbi:hypothetical protein LX32DRAFT_154988 [Colletotrichum zoysiae]|uniref:Uncharacterized protein n=1 Tax=Colletotrichum zoysiae TaxID=1216348 RepID=A0AAD9M7Y5_9PEZI|nr:hypothetical protein LX32DRAFT_154988 [Colletotrichum zoysiae]